MTKKYIATVVIKRELEKEILIPDNLNNDMIKAYIEDDFIETHYENFDESWQNSMMLEEEYEIIDFIKKESE